MTRDEIAKEFDRFFEFDTEDRSTVTSVSARLFAERIVDLTVAAERERIKQANAPEIEKINAYMKALAECVAVERERIAAWVEDMCVGLDANTIANGIRNNGNDDIRAFEVRNDQDRQLRTGLFASVRSVRSRSCSDMRKR